MTWIPSAIGAGASLFGMLGGNDNDKAAERAFQQATRQAGQIQEQFNPFAQQMLGNAASALPQAMSFWAPILGGSRTGATSVLSPDIQRIQEQFGGILQGTRGERSGAGASIYAAAPYKQQEQIQSLFSSLRPQAAQQLGQLGAQAGGIGTSVLSGLISAIGALTGAGTGSANLGANQFQNSMQQGQALGASLAELFDQLDLGKN